MDVTTIVVSYNTAHLLPEMMAKLRKSSIGLESEVIFVDNASSDASAALIRDNYSDCKLIENHVNVGFGRANNQALPFVRGRFVLLLNTDAFVGEDTLRKTVDYMDKHKNCGILGVSLVGRDNEPQASARTFLNPWGVFLQRTNLMASSQAKHKSEYLDTEEVEARHCDWVPGCYYLIRKEVIDQVGLFDPRFFLYCEELDHCFATKRAGWDVVCYTGTKVMHLGGESAKFDGVITKSGRQLQALGIESEWLYWRKNYGAFAVYSSLILQTIADAIDILRRLINGMQGELHPPESPPTKLRWSLFLQTKCGTQPTR